MSLFNQMIGSASYSGQEIAKCATGSLDTYKPRTFKETIKDQLAFHQERIDVLQAVLDSLSPEVEKFVEALQRVG